MQFAGGNVDKAKPHSVKAKAAAGQIIVARFVEHRAFNHGAGGNHANHIALDKPFCRFGVFHLLANRDFVAAGHQLRNVPVGAVERHAAHRRALLLPTIAPG